MKNHYSQILEKLKQQHQRNGWEINEQRIRQQAWMLNDRLMNESALNNANASSAAAGGGSGNRRGNNVVTINAETSLFFFVLNNTLQYMLFNYTDNIIGNIVDTGLDPNIWVLQAESSGSYPTLSVQYRGYIVTLRSNSDYSFKLLIINSIGEIISIVDRSSNIYITNWAFPYVMVYDGSDVTNLGIFNGDNYKVYNIPDATSGSSLNSISSKFIYGLSTTSGGSVYLLDGVSDAINFINVPDNNFYCLGSDGVGSNFIFFRYENNDIITNMKLVDSNGNAIYDLDLTSNQYTNLYIAQVYGDGGNFVLVFNSYYWYVFEGNTLTQYTSEYQVGSVHSGQLIYSYDNLENTSNILAATDTNSRYIIYKFPGDEFRTFDTNGHITSVEVTESSIGVLSWDGSNLKINIIQSGGVINNIITYNSNNILSITALYDRFVIQRLDNGDNYIYNYDGTLLDSAIAYSFNYSGDSILLTGSTYSYFMNSSSTNFVTSTHSYNYYSRNIKYSKDILDGHLLNISNDGYGVYITNTLINQFVVTGLTFSNISSIGVKLSSDCFIITYNDNTTEYNMCVICDFNGNILETINGGSYNLISIVKEDRVILYYIDGSQIIHNYIYSNGVVYNYNYPVGGNNYLNFVNDITYQS